MDDHGRRGVEEVHAARHVQRDADAGLPGNLHCVVLGVLVVDGVVEKVEEVAVVAVPRDETHGVHHQTHEKNDVGVAQRAHQNDLRVEVANGLCRHARHAQLLHCHLAASAGNLCDLSYLYIP